MINAYLADTNFASALFVTKRKDNPQAVAYLQKIKATGGLLYLSRIAIAEMEYGLALNPKLDSSVVAQVKLGITRYSIRELEEHTTQHYAEIRANLFDKKGKRDTKGKLKRGQRPEEFTALKPTALELGIQENDLWMAAIAVQRKMILVTDDRMNHIRDVFPSLDYEQWKV